MLLRLLTEAMRVKLDALVSGLTAATAANDSLPLASPIYPALRVGMSTTVAPSRN